MPKLLLVEDNEMNRDMLSRRLTKRGFEVAVAANGEEALAVAATANADVILLDLSLPLLDGWEVARRLKRDDALKSTPIIALTAHALSDDREKAMAAGCDDYDTKPVEFPRLLGKIEALLARKAAATA